MGLFEHFPFTNFHELNLDWILAKVKKADARMDDIDSAADSAEAWATGEINGEPVSEDAPQYHNSAKYWSTQVGEDMQEFVDEATAQADAAADSATAAAGSATAAAGSAQQAAASAADTTQSTLAERWAEESEAWAVGTKDGTPVSSGATQYQNNSKYWAEQAAQSQGANIFGNTTEYFDKINLAHTEWGYRFGTVAANGILFISLSAQETVSNQAGELVVNIAKMSGDTPIEYAIAQETGSGDPDKWTAVETAAFMKVNAGDRIRLGAYRHSQISGAPTITADTNIIAIGTTIALDAGFTQAALNASLRGVGKLSQLTLEKE